MHSTDLCEYVYK